MRMALALNNLTKFDMPLNKETKPNQFVWSQLNGSKYCYITLQIQFNVSHLFEHSYIVKQYYLTHEWNSNTYNHSE